MTRYIKYDTTAATISVSQNACHTPQAPNTRLSRKARGSITMMYRISDIIRDAVPFPRPSRAPDSITGTDEMMNPALMILMAEAPMLTISASLVNIPIRRPGIRRHTAVPASIIQATVMVAIFTISRTRSFLPAP